MRATRVALVIVAFLAAPIGTAAQIGTGGTAMDRALDELFGTFSLPRTVTAAREAGVADSTITGVLDRIRRAGLPAADAEDVLEQEVEVIRAGGPVGNFGAFVQSQLDAGLRGRALADAIRAEHRRLGIGIPERRMERDRVRENVRRGDGQGGAAQPGRGGERGGPGGPPTDSARGRSGRRGAGGTP